MRKNRITTLFAALVLAAAILTTGCSADISSTTGVSDNGNTENTAETQTDNTGSDTSEASIISISDIPEYNGEIYIEVKDCLREIPQTRSVG